LLTSWRIHTKACTEAGETSQYELFDFQSQDVRTLTSWRMFEICKKVKEGEKCVLYGSNLKGLLVGVVQCSAMHAVPE